jgi:TnpA family transposase
VTEEPERMSEACRETTWRQLSWTADWHLREECYAQALAGLINAHHRQPLAAHWGGGALFPSSHLQSPNENVVVKT